MRAYESMRVRVPARPTASRERARDRAEVALLEGVRRARDLGEVVERLLALRIGDVAAVGAPVAEDPLARLPTRARTPGRRGGAGSA